MVLENTKGHFTPVTGRGEAACDETHTHGAEGEKRGGNPAAPHDPGQAACSACPRTVSASAVEIVSRDRCGANMLMNACA
ncbi:hypothetical protein CUPL110328_12580 [Cupriavidus plantarum]|nr:hypothetical protein LMG26296_01206 [Cupriavidus plantarum]SMR66662.1 hypothetical protein SAMN05421735_1547 [Cupriavidus plantarum]